MQMLMQCLKNEKYHGEGDPVHKIEVQPVATGDVAPAGSLWVDVTSPSGEFFVPGKNYAVTFTQVPD